MLCGTFHAACILDRGVSGRHYLLYILLTVDDVHLHAELLMNMLGQMLGAIHAAVLAAGAAEAEHQVGEAALDVACHMTVAQ